jgi:hypothetical protein
MQVAFEEREQCILQPASIERASSLEKVVPVPTTPVEDDIANGTDLEL